MRTRCTSLLASGLVLAAACRDAGEVAPHRPPGWDPRTVWVAADRDGDALIELDHDLFVLGRRTLESPLCVRSGGESVWVVHAPQGSPEAPLALRRWDAAGPGPSLAVGELLGLEIDGRGRALVLDRAEDGSARLGRFSGSGEPCDLGAPRGALALALGPLGPALALGEGGWAAQRRDGAWFRRAGFEGGSVLDLAPRPGGGWWTLVRLAGEPAALCVALDGEGIAREVQAVGPARRLARRAAAPWAWETDGRAVCPPGAHSGREVGLALSGARAALGDGAGGLLLAAAGALLRLDASGAARPGQGGFARLVDLERLDPLP